MARKGIMSALLDDTPTEEFTAVNSETSKPALPVETSGRRGAFGMMSRAADEVAAKVAAAEEIEKQLQNGVQIIELDPEELETSFVIDRLDDDDDTSLQELISAIRERGQDTPILVRPSVKAEGKYQIVFGHRRAKAAKVLGIRVKATVKPLSDRDHAIAQGQENTARADLSFIERALFAKKLADQFDNEAVMSALGVNKTVLSKMQSVTNHVPADVILKIGAARNIGRDRWYDLSVLLKDGKNPDFSPLLAQEKFGSATSDDRFLLIFETAKNGNKPAPKPREDATEAKSWTSNDKSVNFTMNRKPKKVDISFKSENAGAFGDWLKERLDALLDEFNQSEKQNNGD